MDRKKIPDTSGFGETIGYSRAVRAGDLIFVAGMTASGPFGNALHPGDAASQAKLILGRITAMLKEFGAEAEHIVETRIFLTNMSDWEDVARVHGAVFKEIRPATTIVQIGPLLSPDLRVEISAIASLATA